MKRIVSILLLLAMMLSLAACCGSSAPATEPAPQAPQSGEAAPAIVGNFAVPEGGYDGSEVTIKFYHTMGANLAAVLDLYIEEFNNLYPNIHIEYTQVGGYDDVREQISTEITVGGQPNIAYCYPDHVALYNLAKAVTTLDELIESDIGVTRADGPTEILGPTAVQNADTLVGDHADGLHAAVIQGV